MSVRLAASVGFGALALLGIRVATLPRPEPCGLACARFVLAYTRPGARLRRVQTRPNGMMSVSEVAEALASAGLKARVVTPRRFEDLPSVTPVILHLEEGHFVVLLSFGPHSAEVLDPAFGSGGTYSYPRSEIEASWSGYAILVSAA